MEEWKNFSIITRERKAKWEKRRQRWGQKSDSTRDCREWEARGSVLKAFRDVTFNKQVWRVAWLNATQRNFMEIYLQGRCGLDRDRSSSSFIYWFESSLFSLRSSVGKKQSIQTGEHVDTTVFQLSVLLLLLLLLVVKRDFHVFFDYETNFSVNAVKGSTEKCSVCIQKLNHKTIYLYFLTYFT